MKRCISILFPVLMIALAGCSKEQLNITNSGGNPDNKMIATIEGTKTSLDGVTMKWQMNDQFNVAGYNDWLINNVTTSHLYVLDDADAGKTKGTFTSENPVSAGQQSYFGIHGGSGYFTTDYFIKYFFKENQNYVENGIEDGIMPLYAYGTSLDNMGVYYCGCIMRLQMYSTTTVNIKSITIRAANEVTGHFHISPKVAPTNPCMGPAGATGKTTVTLSVADAAGVALSTDATNPSSFNIVLPGYTMNVLVIEIMTTDNKLCRVTKSNMAAEPGKIYKMKAFAFEESPSSHVLLSIDGSAPVELYTAIANYHPNSSVVVSTSDDTDLTDSELAQISNFLNTNATSPIALDLSDIDVPDNIFNTWFYDCKKLASVILPSSTEQVGASEAYVLPSTLTNLVLNEGLKKINASAISNYSGVLNLPTTVTDIAWRNTAKVTGITVAEGGVFTAVNDVLYKDEGHTLIAFPGGKTEDSFTHFTIPEGVTKIASYAFQSCKNIVELTIPASVTTIEVGPFSETKITKITVLGGLNGDGTPATTLGGITYSDTSSAINKFPESGDIYFPNDNVGKYRVADGWKNFTLYRKWTVHDASAPVGLGMPLSSAIAENGAEIDYE